MENNIDMLAEINGILDRATGKIRKIPISKLDVDLIGQKVEIEGILQASSQIMIHLENTRYVCQKCNEVYFKRVFKCEKCPSRCVSEETSRQNLIKIRVMEEKKELKSNTSIFTIEVWIPGKLAKDSVDKLFVGETYTIKGVVKSMKRAKTKSEEEIYLEATELIPKLKGIKYIPLSEEQIEKVKVLSQDPDKNKKLIKSIFGNIVSQDVILEALLLQMISSPKVFECKTMTNRGKLMILLTGNPGGSKSQILQRATNFYPRSMFVSGKSTTGIGLVAKVDRDENLGTWVAYPGAIPLCSPDGICAIDEVSLITNEVEHLNHMMEALAIPIAKANVHVTIPADVSLLCAMNPEDTIFIEDKPYITQLGLPRTFIDRLDLIFNVDYFEKSGHSNRVLKAMAKIDDNDEDASEEENLDREIALAYIVYAHRIDPRMSVSARQQLIEEYKSLAEKRDNKAEDYYSYRLFNTLWRLAAAYARLRFSDEVDFTDIKNAKEMLLESLKSMRRVKVVSGQLKIDEEDMSGVKPLSKLKQKDAVFSVIESHDIISYNDLKSQLNITSTEVDEALEYLKGKGKIFEPRPNLYKRL